MSNPNFFERWPSPVLVVAGGYVHVSLGIVRTRTIASPKYLLSPLFPPSSSSDRWEGGSVEVYDVLQLNQSQNLFIPPSLLLFRSCWKLSLPSTVVLF